MALVGRSGTFLPGNRTVPPDTTFLPYNRDALSGTSGHSETHLKKCDQLSPITGSNPVSSQGLQPTPGFHPDGSPPRTLTEGLSAVSRSLPLRAD